MTPVPSSKPARVVKLGRMCTCQWYIAGRTVGGGVEDDVVGDVAEALADRPEGAAHRPPDADDAGRGRPVEVGAVVAGHDEDLVGGPAPERAEGDGLVGRLEDPVAEPLLGGRRRADQASAGEPGEAGLLLGELPRHERDPEQLAVRMGDGGAGLAAVVDDHLAVAQTGGVLVLLARGRGWRA